MEAVHTFGGWLKWRRRGLGLTQKELAQRVGYATVTLRKVEADELRPSWQMAKKLAEALQLTPEEEAQFVNFARDEAYWDDITLPVRISSPPIPAPHRTQEAFHSGSGEQDQTGMTVITRHRLSDPVESELAGERLALKPSANNLPYNPTPFVGREQEISNIVRRLQDPDCRLLTLAGPGGIGKTRLAVEVAQRLLNSLPIRDGFPHGSFFVSLQPVSTVSEMILVIADAASFHFYGDVSSREQLLGYLRQKRMLLILDNFEQLLSHAELVEEIVATAPDVKILITSREGLRLRQEWFHPVSGMRFSEDPSDRQEAVSDYDAVRLFVQSAQRVQPSFSLSEEQESVLRICQMVDGVPLAIELAAAWRKALPCALIANEIEHGLDILTALHQDIPPRHRSIRAVLEQSWQSLSDMEQNVLMRLSVFQGGIRLDAAAKIAGATLLILESLVQQSLLQSAQNGRFQMHELLRQFADEKLAKDPETAATAQRQHAAFYLRFVQQRTERILGREQREALIEIDREIGNLRAAWNRAIAHDAVDEIDGAMHGLFHYYQSRSQIQEGRDSFALARSHFASGIKSKNARFLSRLTLRLTCFYINMAQYGDAEALLSSLDLAQSDTHEEAFVLYLRGMIAEHLHKDRIQAEALLRESLEIAQQTNDLVGQILALRWLASVLGGHGRPAEAEELLTHTLMITRRVGQPAMVADVLIALGWEANFLGHYTKAQTCWEEALAIYQELGDEQCTGNALQWLGWASWCAGNSHLAAGVRLYEEAITIYERTGTPLLLPDALCDMSLALAELGDADRAMECALKGLYLIELTGNIHKILYALTTAGAAACARADYVDARRYLVRSLSLAQEHHVSKISAPALHYFADVLLAESESGAKIDAQDEKKRQALQLYCAVINEPAAWQVLKDRAKVRLDYLATVLPPMTMAEGASETKSVEEWAAKILASAS